jgi:ATPase subunit of ABC transporter with duplicated ATPase domains
MRLLKQHAATQILVSHDTELLNHHVDTLWHIVDGQIRVFHGKYAYYLEQLQQEKEQLSSQLSQLKRAQKAQHEALMTEQERRKKKKAHGEKKYDKDKIALRSAQGRGERTANKNNAYLNQVKSHITEQKDLLWQSEEIHYSFDIISGMDKKSGISIQDGSCGYETPFLNNINLHISGGNRVALEGPNGSGKSLLIKAILHNPAVQKTGEWLTPLSQDIAYLDQHYSLLPQDKTVLEHLETLNASFTHPEWRHFLNQFLFRKNDEVYRPIRFLSGGEKARLSLAAIALQRPKLLILDEVTNNIDLTTKNHITQILKTYTGTLIIISHETDFLRAIEVSESYNVCHWKVIK